MKYNLEEICSKFDINTVIGAYGNGHINDTYLCQSNPNCILQRINHHVFTRPQDVMSNIVNVTGHLKEKIRIAGGDPTRETLTVVPATDGKNYYKDKYGNYFRMYRFIENSISYDVVENPIQLYKAGKAFGRFQNMLGDFPAETLYETIKDFHNTPKRVEHLLVAIENDLAGRADSVKPEIDFALEYKKYSTVITDAMTEKTVPLRVTHNDTKLNNVLFDKKTLEAVCIVDLDTVMPGSMLYDFGDALRFGASSGAEDETDLEKIWFDLDKFEEFTKGFLEETKDTITPKEVELLPISALIMTYECGIRFLTDYLNGDLYFKISSKEHNLDRARNQFKLVQDIKEKQSKMTDIVKKYI